jgi:hypothetical protein
MNGLIVCRVLNPRDTLQSPSRHILIRIFLVDEEVPKSMVVQIIRRMNTGRKLNGFSDLAMQDDKKSELLVTKDTYDGDRH